MGKRTRWKPELSGGYVPLYNRILKNLRFKSLSCYSQIVYISALQKAMFAGKFSDGLFTLTPNDFSNMSVSTLRRSIKRLIELGWIVKEEPGGMYRNANKYSLTPLENIFLNY